MDKRLRIAGIVGAIIFSIIVLTSPDDPIPLPELPSGELENNSVEILAENLENPRSIAFADDRVFVTEKDGRIRVVYNNDLLQKKMVELE
jgi:glucose/arabinose dehydrogenase